MIKKRNLILIDLKIIIINDMIKKHYKQKWKNIFFYLNPLKTRFIYLDIIKYNKKLNKIMIHDIYKNDDKKWNFY